MFIERIYDRGLAQASYLIACQESGEAIVIDPRRDIDVYLDLAEREGFRIVVVTETHIHADFLSGARELSAATEATLCLSDEGGEEWAYRFDHRPLRDGDTIQIGNLSVDVLHTPGHTPEHLSFLLTDRPAGQRPRMIFTGDFLFVGDVGRPDLLDEAAGYSGTRETGARALYSSLRRLDALSADLLVWPGHGAGSACGKALGAVPVTTLGFERETNPAMQFGSEDDFVSWLLDGQPEVPRYFGMMKRLNRERPETSILPARLAVAGVPVIDPGSIDNHADREAVQIVDLRTADLFEHGHIPGSINIPFTEDISKWLGWLLDYDRSIIVVAAPDERETALRSLIRVGLDRCTAFIDSQTVTTKDNGEGAIRTVSVNEARELIRNGTSVLDVRSRSEYAEGHIDGAQQIHVGHLPETPPTGDPTDPILVHCRSGYRSSIAASILLQKGFREIYNLAGGYDAWRA